MHRDRAEPAGKAHTRRHHHLGYRTPKPSEVIHGLITSLAAMRWPIATRSSIAIVAFQNYDESVRASLYKKAPTLPSPHADQEQIRVHTFNPPSSDDSSGLTWLIGMANPTPTLPSTGLM